MKVMAKMEIASMIISDLLDTDSIVLSILNRYWDSYLPERSYKMATMFLFLTGLSMLIYMSYI